MSSIGNYIIPIIILIIILHGLFRTQNIFTLFLEGAKTGFGTVLGIAPSFIALIFAINMLQSSGALEIITSLISPFTNVLGIPAELVPLAVLSPVSGSGSLGMFETILNSHHPDSFLGRCASVMMGSTETTFYTMTLYYGSVSIKNTRHTLPCALCADITSFILSPIIVSLFFSNQ